jgi:prepilin signal peptidase PulO-like enzyme (type II secretory pathway)
MIAWKDGHTRKIPGRCILGLGMLGVCALFLYPDMHLYERFAGAFFISLLMCLSNSIFKGGFGAGDIKLVSICGWILGIRAITVACIIAIFTSGMYCVAGLLTGRLKLDSRFALGPFLCLGFVIAIFN